MNLLFKTVISMSVAASIIYFVLLIIRHITLKFFSTSWHYYTKFIIVLILLIPCSLIITSSKINIINNDTGLENNMHSFSNTFEPTENETFFYEQHKNIYKNNVIKDFFNKLTYKRILLIIQYIWLVGFITLSLLKIKQYLKFKKLMRMNNELILGGSAFDIFEKCKKDMHIKSNIRLASNKLVGTPLIMGLFTPTIVIPIENLGEEELWFIMRHELIHFARGDLWIKILALIANLIHWYNPISYFLIKDINYFGEMSCDEILVKDMDLVLRKKYASTILQMLDRNKELKYSYCSTLSRTKKQIMKRMINMMNYKKIKKVNIICSILVIMLIGTIGVYASTVDIEIEKAREKSEKSESFTNDIEHEKNEIISTFVINLIRNMHIPKNERGNIELQNLNEQNTVQKISIIWPTPKNEQISSFYGLRIHPITGATSMHTGIDIIAEKGDSIVAVQNGTVKLSSELGGYGNTVIIEHDNEISTLYAHCSILLVKDGSRVTKGQIIGKVGNSGACTGSHLHFEVRENGEFKDPLDYLNYKH